MKNVLYFFPINPLEMNEGNKARALSLLKYFKKRGLNVDFVSLQNFGSTWSPENIESLRSAKLVNRVFILSRKPLKGNAISYFFKHKISELLFQARREPVKGSIPNHTTFYLKSAFESILKKNSYDSIIISYAYWADLIKGNQYLKNAITIIDTHDFLSAQHQRDKKFNIGLALGEEIRRLNLFSQIWAISTDEYYFFSQFCGAKARYVPMMLNTPKVDKVEKKYDIIYVASKNPHNIASCQWFFDRVYPLISADYQLLVIGQICDFINDYPNVEKIPFAGNLSEYYQLSKIAMCPMLSGTGVKVKVIEALSFGLPVVCTLRGVDGLPNKTENGCLVADNEELFASNICGLLHNSDLYNKHRDRGKTLFNTYFSEAKMYNILDSLFCINSK